MHYADVSPKKNSIFFLFDSNRRAFELLKFSSQKTTCLIEKPYPIKAAVAEFEKSM